MHIFNVNILFSYKYFYQTETLTKMKMHYSCDPKTSKYKIRFIFLKLGTRLERFKERNIN